MERFFGKGLDNATKDFVKFPYPDNAGPVGLNLDGITWSDDGEHGEFKKTLRSCFIKEAV